MQVLDAETVQAITDGSLRSVRGRVDLFRGDRLVWLDLPLDAARPSRVDVDATAATERTCTLNVAPDNGTGPVPLLPLLGGPLAPYGTEARCYVDLGLPSGRTVSLPQGVFGIRAPSVADKGAPVISVAGRDRSQRVVDAVLAAPYDVASGTNIASAIAAFVLAGVPSATMTGFDPTLWPYTSTDWHFADGDDRWAKAQEMAASVGAYLSYDLSGTLRMLPVPDPAGALVAWTYAEGAGSTATSVAQTLDANTSYSHASVVGQPQTGPPVRSDAYDTDPASPTYWLGPFGDRPIRFVSSFVATQAQADSAAAALLRSRKGLVENVTVTSVLPWAHEARDVIIAKRSGLGIDAKYVLSSFPVPLGPGQANLVTRSRRVTS